MCAVIICAYVCIVVGRPMVLREDRSVEHTKKMCHNLTGLAGFEPAPLAIECVML